jgi:hypothetical protein
VFVRLEAAAPKTRSFRQRHSGNHFLSPTQCDSDAHATFLSMDRAAAFLHARNLGLRFEFESRAPVAKCKTAAAAAVAAAAAAARIASHMSV